MRGRCHWRGDPRRAAAWWAAGVLLSPALVTGQTGDTTLDAVTVTAPRLERPWLDTPSALGVIEPEDLQQARQGLQLDEALGRVPGVIAQNRYNFAQDLRLSMRGFGARAAFGIRGIRILVDGIPETTPDGQSQVDAIDLTVLERAEVIRGPSSVLYGNATGGVLDLTTRGGPSDPYVQLRGQAGSYGYRRGGVHGGGTTGDLGWHLSAWDFSLDGYRAQSKAEKRLLHTRFDWDPAPEHRLTAVLTALDAPRTDDPGALTAAEAAADPRAAAPNALRFDAGQAAEQRRMGLVYRGEPDEGHALQARVFHTRRDFENRLPFQSGGAVAYDRQFSGAGLQYTRSTEIAGLSSRTLLGTDLELQRDERRRFDNLEGERGALTLEQREEARALGVFLQQELKPGDRFTLTLGARRDSVRLSIDDRFLADGDDSGRRRFEETSYAAAFSHAFHPDHRLYGTASTAFETPSFTELANPAGGGFNPDLVPQHARNLELGVKGFAGALQYDVALFRVDVRDELVPFELDDPDDNRTYYENAGRTRRQGLEAGASWFPTLDLELTAAWTWSDFTFRRFEDDGLDLRGRELPTIPRHQLFAEAAWRRGDVYIIGDVLSLGRRYADNANTERVSGHTVANLRAGRVLRRGGWELEGFVAVNNVFDESYFSNIRPNAAFGRYYEPAPERNWLIGLNVTPGRR